MITLYVNIMIMIALDRPWYVYEQPKAYIPDTTKVHCKCDPACDKISVVVELIASQSEHKTYRAPT